jgi:tRNA(Arg) A34 adenosine deaminase TadA
MLDMTPLRIDFPPWVGPFVDWGRAYLRDEAKMQLAIDLARENVVRRTGGPFGAAVFEATSGKLVAVGVNLVAALNNSTLHGEIVALMAAQARLQTFTLGAAGAARYEIVTSCEPCAMCLGAIFWSGATRVVCGATGEDARALGFDEGPVFPESYAYLARLGIELVYRVRRDEARAVLQLYVDSGGPIYNPSTGKSGLA